MKFFRRIRQNLLSEGKTNNYLKYATGEIILLVIGILIALQINNWNENRKAYINSKNYLREILNDLRDDTLNFNYIISYVDIVVNDEEWVLNTANHTNSNVNRLLDCIYLQYTPYEINDKTFQKIQNKGISKLVGFDTLSEKINRYYTILKYDAEGFTDWDKFDARQKQINYKDLQESIEISNYRMQQMSGGQMNKEFPMLQDSITHSKRIIEFANSIRGRNLFKSNYIKHYRVQNWLKEHISETTNLIKEIEQELE